MEAQHKMTSTSKEHSFTSLKVKFLDCKSRFIKNGDNTYFIEILQGLKEIIYVIYVKHVIQCLAQNKC